ncbi:MAG: hypothetical protein RH862_05715 [Leptospiraceae bacterium]
MKYCLPLLAFTLLLSCKGAANPELLKGTEWLCVDTVDPADEGKLKYPDKSNPPEDAFREVYSEDGHYLVFDMASGESLLGEGVAKARYILEKSEKGDLVLSVDLFVEDGKWTSQEERIPYIIKELTESNFHSVADELDYGERYFNESKCVRLN